jgi:hypothetical protein
MPVSCHSDYSAHAARNSVPFSSMHDYHETTSQSVAPFRIVDRLPMAKAQSLSWPL